ncbi:MAG: thermonuclease family protein [Candidatus Saccharimonadales bacterium]
MSKPRILTKKQTTTLVGLLATLAITLLVRFGLTRSVSRTASQSQPGLYRVSQFIDGDTFAVKMNGATEKIRFIGVDTPETHDPRKAVQCFGKAASNFTQHIIGKQPIRLQADSLNTNRDRYNRLLRYVYLPNGTLLNAELIKQGYGFAYTSFPFSKRVEFRRLQTEAQQSKKGLWSSCQPTKNKFGGYTSNDAH